MARINPIRTVIAVAVGATLAAGAFTQTASFVLADDAPETARAFSALNGAAAEKLAFQRFLQASGSPAEIENSAIEQRPGALRAVALEPYASKAHVILALSESDPKKRAQLIVAAGEKNKRDISLQILVLQTHLEGSNASSAIDALDRILRVQTSRRQEFYPVLVQILSRQETLPIFEGIFGNDAAWHEEFFYSVLRSREALVNLATLRPRMVVESEEVDQLMVSTLVRQGETAKAKELYQFLSSRVPANGDQTSDETTQWPSRFAPFDWDLADEAGKRAQISRDGSTLEIYVRSGKGGVVASRVLERPEGEFQIAIAHDKLSERETEGVRIELKCLDTNSVILNDIFQTANTNFTLPASTADESCAYLQFSLSARSWTGAPPFELEIQEISIN